MSRLVAMVAFAGLVAGLAGGVGQAAGLPPAPADRTAPGSFNVITDWKCQEWSSTVRRCMVEQCVWSDGHLLSCYTSGPYWVRTDRSA